MMRPARVAVVVALLTTSLVVDGAPVVARRVPRCGAKELSLTFDLNRKRYSRGQPVRAVMRVENVSGAACRAVFRNSKRSGIVFKRKRRAIYNDNRCYFFTDAVITETWKAGHEDVYRFVWKKRDNRRRSKACLNGRSPRAPRGAYTARASFHGAYYKAGALRSPRAWLRLN